MLILTAWLSWYALFMTTQDAKGICSKESVSSTLTRISHTFSAVWLYSKILSAKAVLFSAYYLPWNPWLRLIDPWLLIQPCQEESLHLFGVLLAVEEAGLENCSSAVTMLSVHLAATSCGFSLSERYLQHLFLQMWIRYLVYALFLGECRWHVLFGRQGNNQWSQVERFYICWTEGCLNDFVTAKYPKDKKHRQSAVAG